MLDRGVIARLRSDSVVEWCCSQEDRVWVVGGGAREKRGVGLGESVRKKHARE
jgi:hypothetical protein